MNTKLVTRPRALERKVQGRAVMEGAGVKINRALTQSLQQRLDPFLMLDAFKSDDPQDYLAGFPEHPHRGFETVTYMIAGKMRHKDSAGHEGLLENGGVQWMSAASGVVHSEMPEQENGRMEGFQLWLNLPATEKMSTPWYRDFKTVPSVVTDAGVAVHVIAGQSHGTKGLVEKATTQALYLDLHLPAGSEFTQAIPAGHNAFIYVYRGDVEVEGSAVASEQLAIFANEPESDGIRIQSPVASRVLLFSGQPLKEPIVQYGPFVMNSQEEISQAVADFRAGRLGEL
jgi:quercetin 2,3-dioxygenase